MAAYKLDPQDIRNICIKRVSGVTQKVLAQEYSSSVDRIGDIQKRNKDIMNMFIKSGDLKKEPIFVINPDHKMLLLHGELVFKDIEITGDKEDGTIICASIWQNEYESNINIVNDITIDECDFGMLSGKLIIGNLITPDSCYIENAVNVKTLELNSVFKDHDVEWSQYKSFEKVDLNEIFKDKNVENPKEEIVEKETAIAAPVFALVAQKPPEYIWNASNKFISITLGRESWNADDSHPKFREALDFLFNDKIEDAVNLINIEKAITEYVEGKIKIQHGVLRYENYILTNGIAKRIVDRMQAGEDFKFFIPFLNNLMENPSERAVNRLFDFLEANDIEITEDGYFIAYKKVGHNYFDLYTNSIDNSPNGKNPPSVPRNQVDENDERTCSRGLHVCSKSYLGSYGGGAHNKVVLCKVHPRDVVAIPKDYNNAKMRTCGYTVIKDVTSEL